MPAFGLAWDHGKRRVLIALVALVTVLAVAASSLGGVAAIEARGGNRTTVKAPIHQVDGGVGAYTSAVTWG